MYRAPFEKLGLPKFASVDAKLDWLKNDELFKYRKIHDIPFLFTRQYIIH
jgi:hypothetical protein